MQTAACKYEQTRQSAQRSLSAVRDDDAKSTNFECPLLIGCFKSVDAVLKSSALHFLHGSTSSAYMDDRRPEPRENRAKSPVPPCKHAKWVHGRIDQAQSTSCVQCVHGGTNLAVLPCKHYLGESFLCGDWGVRLWDGRMGRMRAKNTTQHPHQRMSTADVHWQISASIRY